MNFTQDSPEWHEWRLGGIGASEIAAIIGTCPYNTAHGVWLVKTKRSKGFEGNSFTEHGKELEAAARARYELICMEDMPAACATHPKFTICRASLDGWNQELKRVLEIKCPKGRSVIDAALAGKVAEHYWPQVQYQMAVTGADELDFFVYHEETKTHALVKVKSDVEYQGKLIAAAIEFWEKYVLTDTPPPLTDRDVKVVESPDVVELCEKIKTTGKGERLKQLLAKAIDLAGHPKMRCGNVQVSTVLRQGKFSYHKLTIRDEQNAESETA